MVSIIMPVYNVENYVAQSIQSVLNQTYQEWELVIINDGSTDSTPEAVRSYLTDNRIRFISQSNQGVAAARNAGIEQAQGQLIAFLDGDDLWDPTYLEKMVAGYERSAADIVYCGHDPFVDGEVRKNRPFIARRGNILFYAITNRWIFHIGAVVFLKKFLLNNKLSFYVGCALGEDFELLYKAFAVGKAEPISENLMLYRSRAGSATKSGWQGEKEIGEIDSLERVVSFIVEQYRSSDKDAVLETFADQLAAAKCRLVWKAIQYENYQMATKLLEQRKWLKNLRAAHCQQWRSSRKMERRLIVTNNRAIWKLVAVLSKLKLIRR